MLYPAQDIFLGAHLFPSLALRAHTGYENHICFSLKSSHSGDTMESRVLSRATTVTTISSLRSSPGENHQNVSFVSLKPIGAVGEGGNVIWGRQLRPALLLESSSAPAGLFSGKKEILRPILATASSPAEGSDSTG